MKFIDVKKEVEDVLFGCVDARDDDYVLYDELAKNLGYNVQDMKVGELVKLMYIGKLPTFECVSRTRRKLQESNLILSGTMTTKERRKKNEEKYERFFGNK